MPRRKFNPWKLRPESAAIGVVDRAKAAIGILADDLKSVSELPWWLGITTLHTYTCSYSTI
jgi:hypothetical protein